jgi:hypothetical protein
MKKIPPPAFQVYTDGVLRRKNMENEKNEADKPSENMPAEKKEEVVTPAQTTVEATSPAKKERPLGQWAAISAIVLFAFFGVSAIINACYGISTLVQTLIGTATFSTGLIVSYFILLFINAAACVTGLIFSVSALKQARSQESVFKALAFLLSIVAGALLLMNLTSLICLGWSGTTFSYFLAHVATFVLALVTYIEGDGTKLDHQILFYVAFGLAITYSTYTFGASFGDGWWAFLNVPQSSAFLAFVVLSVLSVIFEERKKN